MRGQPVSHKITSKALSAIEQHAFGMGLVTSGVPLVACYIGGAAHWWSWPPDPLLTAWLNTTLALTIVWALQRRLSPVTEAYRLGMGAGRREQRTECEHRCGHVCGESTHELHTAVGQSAAPATQRHPGRQYVHLVK